MTREKFVKELKKKGEQAADFLCEKECRDVIAEIWKDMRHSKETALEQLHNDLGDALYRTLTEYIKNKNKSYYALAYFRDEKHSEQDRAFLLNVIYENAIIVTDFSLLDNYAKKVITKGDIDKIIRVLYNITCFCISYHRKGKCIVEILEDSYDIKAEVSNGLAELYNKNLLSLKLDYIINGIDSMYAEEE